MDEVRPFEWLTNFDSLSKLLSQSNLFPVDDNEPRRALHVGCGTSTLGESLVERLGYDEVVNADRDHEALAAMERRWNARLGKEQDSRADGEKACKAEKRKRGIMKWHVMDFSTVPATTRLGSTDDDDYPPGYFDLVVDKSTLDCALCSDDAAAGLLLASHASLRPEGGVYFVISFHHVDFVLPLLRDCPGTDWDVHHLAVRREVDVPEHLAGRYKAKKTANEEASVPEIRTPAAAAAAAASAWYSGSFEPNAEYRRTCNVFICRRSGSEIHPLDFDAVRDHVNGTNDHWFKENNPMVTHTRESDLRRAFEDLVVLRRKENSTGGTAALEEMLVLEDCYGVLFTDAEREHLTYAYFLEDWYAFVDDRQGPENEVPKDRMSVDVALLFLKEMQ